MTYTFLIANTVGKIRLIIGDTDTTDAAFTDEELTYFYSVEGTVNLAAAKALEAWANKYAANATQERIGDYSYSQKTAENMRAAAKNLRDTDAMTPVFEWSEPDLTIGAFEDD